ncbi:MAG: hypothetical protein ACI87E_001840 [Mariniblastus sp.]|jgi:hypothetical protein
MTKQKSSPPPPGSGLVGLALVALSGIGIVSAIFGILALAEFERDSVGGGLLLIASAISFGMLLNGLIRK